MSLETIDWMMIAGGIAAIGWVNWYFFLAERRTAATTESKAVATPAHRA